MKRKRKRQGEEKEKKPTQPAKPFPSLPHPLNLNLFKKKKKSPKPHAKTNQDKMKKAGKRPVSPSALASIGGGGWNIYQKRDGNARPGGGKVSSCVFRWREEATWGGETVVVVVCGARDRMMTGQDRCLCLASPPNKVPKTRTRKCHPLSLNPEKDAICPARFLEKKPPQTRISRVMMRMMVLMGVAVGRGRAKSLLLEVWGLSGANGRSGGCRCS